MQIAGKAGAAERDEAGTGVPGDVRRAGSGERQSLGRSGVPDEVPSDVCGGGRGGLSSDVRSGAVATTVRPTLSVGAQFRATFRSLAVLTAVASIAAVLLIGAISMGCYAVVALLGKIRPLREAYQYISGVYDRLIERLGQQILRDARDTPALRLMVSLTLTAGALFVAQRILGKPRPRP